MNAWLHLWNATKFLSSVAATARKKKKKKRRSNLFHTDDGIQVCFRRYVSASLPLLKSLLISDFHPRHNLSESLSLGDASPLQHILMWHLQS